MRFRTIAAFLYSEFFGFFTPIFFGLLTISMVPRMAKIFEVGALNLPADRIAWVLVFLVPVVAALVMPLAFLLAVSITIAKLSSTSELVALQASGVARTRILRYFVSLALVFFLFHSFNTIFVKPYVSFLIKKNLNMMTHGMTDIKPQERVFSAIMKNVYFYADDVSEEIRRVLLFSISENGEADIISADSCSFERQSDIPVFVFSRGNHLHIGAEDGSMMSFDTLSINPVESKSYNEYDVGRGSLPTSILFEKIQKNEATSLQKSEFAKRIFSPLNLFVFLLLAFPLSFGHSRNYKTTGIVISISVGLAYYILFSLIDTLASGTAVNPFVGYLIMNVILIGCGYVYCRKKCGTVE